LAWSLACLILQSFALTNRSFEPDEGMRVYCAREFLNGATPYEDFWDHKDPMEWFLCAFLLKLFGDSISGLRLGVVVLRAILIYQLIGLARQLKITRHLWLVGALSLILLTAEPIQGNTAAMEIPALLFFVLAMRFIMTDRNTSNLKRPALLLGSGLSAGLAISIKPTTAVSCLIPLLLLPVFLQRKTQRPGKTRLFLDIPLLTVGIAIPIIAVAGWCAKKNILDDWLFVLTVCNPAYSQGIPHWDYLSGVLPSRLLFLAPFAGLFLFGIIRRRQDRRIITHWILLWFVLAIVSICLGWRFYPHYFLLLVPPLALAGAASLDILTDPQKPSDSLLNAVTVFLLIAVLLNGFTVARWYVIEAPRWEPPNMGFFTDDSIVELASYIKETTEPDETIYVLGYCPDILVLSERSSPSRYLFKMPLAAEHSPIRTEAKREVLQTLRARPPRYFIVMKKDWTPQHPQHSDAFLQDWWEMAAFVEEHYDLLNSSELYDLYMRA